MKEYSFDVFLVLMWPNARPLSRERRDHDLSVHLDARRSSVCSGLLGCRMLA
jgi:hypothetical protein